MMKCALLNKEFATKREMFLELQAQKSTLIAAKKAEIKMKDNKSVIGFMDMKSGTVKAIPNMDDAYIYPIISNTNYLDNHKDVHLNKSMNKTAKNMNKKVYYVADHDLKIDSVIATPRNVEIMLETMTWKELGRNYEGETECLIFKIAKDKIIHDKFKQMIKDEEDLQNSIRMLYVDLDMAINSDDEDFKGEFKVFNEVYPKIANKDDFDDLNWFWAVRELKIYMEGSAVLFGSNDATPVKNIADSSDDTQQETAQELASKALQEEQKTFYKSLLKNN